MSYSCIVEGCKNNRTNVLKSNEYVSFFRLPQSDVMREGWLKRIGQVKMPANSDNVRICSAHFTPNSFVNSIAAKIQTAQRNIRRRRLVPHAVPTLKLIPTSGEESDNNERLIVEESQQPELKVIYREFVLHAQHSASKGKLPSHDKEITNSHEKLDLPDSHQSPGITSLVATPSLHHSYSAQPVETLTPKSSLKNDSHDAICTPTGEETKHYIRAEATFPRRSERLVKAKDDHQHDTFSEKAKKLCRVTPKNLYNTRKNNRTSHSAEEPPAWKRRKQFITEHLNGTGPSKRIMTKEEDPQQRIQCLTENVHYLQSLLQFYKSTKSKQQEENEQLRARCAAYALELKEEQDGKIKMFGEIGELKKLNEELYDKLRLAGIEKTMCKEQQKSIVHSILQPYFTEGQIRCIIEGRKWVKWSDDDFAAAVALRNVSPKAYEYLLNKLNFPFPSSSSLRRWRSQNNPEVGTNDEKSKEI